MKRNSLALLTTILLLSCFLVQLQSCKKGNNDPAPTPKPTITSFTPTSGPIGTAVTILGVNFDNTPSGNTVLFNGTPTAVTSATATSLTVTVPSTATSGKIGVSVKGQIATSSGDFEVTAYVPTLKDLITVTTAADYDPDSPDHWILVHDKDGKLLEYDRIVKGSTIKLTTMKEIPDNIVSITFITHAITTWDYHSLTTYTNVTPGIVWQLKPGPASTLPPDDGAFDIKISNCPLNLGSVSASPTRSIALNLSGSDVSVHVGRLSGIKKYFLSISTLNGAHYKFLDNIEAGSSTNMDYSDLSASANNITFTFPPTTLSGMNSTGFESGQTVSSDGLSYTVQNVFNGLTSSSIIASFPSEFTNYMISVYATYGKMHYQYVKIGAPPTANYALPTTATFNVSNTSCKNFALTGTPAFNIRVSNWSKFSASTNAITFWDVHSPAATQKLTEFPAEILSLYPNIILDDIGYSGTYLYIQSKPYADYLVAPHTTATGFDLFGTEYLIVGKDPD